MTLAKTVQKYLPNIFIAVVQNSSNWTIYYKVVKAGVIKSKSTKSFEVTSSEEIPPKMQKYLEDLQLEYNFAYIALFLDSMGQGAIKGINAEDFTKNSVDVKSVSHFVVENSWSVYASFIDINWVKKLFSNVGLDFIYSPFIIQYALLKKQKLKQKPILYILNHADSVTITVFDGLNLEFGAFFKTATDDNLTSGDEENWEEAEEIEGVENLVELDSIEDDDIGGVDELDDLNELEDLDSKDISFEDIKEEDKDLGHFDEDEQSDLELFGRDVLVYKYLKNSLEEYYKNPIYDSSFIDTVVLYDGYEISSELIDMIENELLMDIELHKIDIPEVVCDMAIKEVFK